jgi:uncharacterized protein
MRNSLKILSASFILLVLTATPLFAFQIPSKPDGYVTDQAGLLPSQAKQDLETMLRSFEEQTSNQVVVATFPSLDGENLEDISMKIAEKWKPGQKGKDNGAILLIFQNDRKMRIEVGYGLEGVLPDALAGQIISQVIAPKFKQGDYFEGISLGVQAIIAATKGEYKAQPPKDKTYTKLFFLLALLFGMQFLARNSGSGIGRRGGRYGGYFVPPMGGFRRGGGGFSGGGFSGGGGGFGGGGASGGW